MSDYPTSTDPTSGRYHEPETIDADAILDGDTDDGAAPEPIRIRSTDGEGETNAVVAYTDSLPVRLKDAGCTFSREDAARLFDRIRLRIIQTAESQHELGLLIEQAYDGQAWIALGYPTGMEGWKQCCADQFSTSAMKLTATQRADVILQIDPAMSNVAVAAALGVNESSVRRARKKSGTAKPKRIVGADGKYYSIDQLTADERTQLDTKIWDMYQGGKGMTQTRISEALDLSQSTVSDSLRREKERRMSEGLMKVDVPDGMFPAGVPAPRLDASGLDPDTAAWVAARSMDLRDANAIIATVTDTMMNDRRWRPGGPAVGKVMDKAVRDLLDLVDNTATLVRLLDAQAERILDEEDCNRLGEAFEHLYRFSGIACGAIEAQPGDRIDTTAWA